MEDPRGWAPTPTSIRTTLGAGIQLLEAEPDEVDVTVQVSDDVVGGAPCSAHRSLADTSAAEALDFTRLFTSEDVSRPTEGRPEKQPDSD